MNRSRTDLRKRAGQPGVVERQGKSGTGRVNESAGRAEPAGRTVEPESLDGEPLALPAKDDWTSARP